LLGNVCSDIFLKSQDILRIINLLFYGLQSNLEIFILPEISSVELFKKISQAKGQAIMDKLLPLLKHEEEKPLILAKFII